MSHYNMPIAEYVYTEHFEEMNVAQDVYLTFTDKKNSNDRFLYVYDLLKQYDWLPTKCDGYIRLSQAHRQWRKRLKKSLKKVGIFINMDCTTANKNNDTSDQYRSRGNEAFKIKNYEESLKMYTRSIMTAEIDSPNFALSVANRSAALYYLEEYEHSLKDIDQAFKSKQYPLQNHYKLFERKGNCYRQMNQPSIALEFYWDCLSYLDSNTYLTLDARAKIKIRISGFVKKSEEAEEKVKKMNLKYKRFKKLEIDKSTNLLKCVEIQNSKEMGRGLFASKNIKPGEILIIEEPIAGVFKNSMWMFNCNYCFKRCLSAIPCSKCSQVVYCDDTCLQKAYASYHNTECSLVYPLKEDPTVEPTHDLALRCFMQLVNVMGIDHYCSMVQKYNESNFSCDGSSNHLIDPFYSIYALDGNEVKRTVSNLFFMHCTASMMVSLLLLNKFDIPSNLLGTVGESLVHLLCIANLNSYASIELSKYIGKSSDNIVANRPATFDSVALILCTAYSLINHSCDPNVIVQTYSGIEVTRAIQPILKGSQVFTDYGVKFMSHNKKERSIHLFDQYQFQCQCQACMNNWPNYASMELNELFIGYDSLSINDEENDQLSIPKSTLSKFNKIVNLLLTQRKINIDYLDFLFSFLDLLYFNFKKPCTIYYKCIQLVQTCLYYTSDQVHYMSSNKNIK
ncbi:SET and MYND domain-containing protein 4-like [Rhopalosiphum padi]|uniref:SET and MYND domain-containing protein 4-like n=1 Tax=Rhopalosiphum padi TaxID=40932 RepID=UPI00298DB34F|nr:SET and MYND domain-containing protein 4-like [Rhopalosiphum padi]